MKHIQAGGIVSFVFAVILLVTMMIWWGLVGLFGTTAATLAVFLVFAVGVAVTLIDWLTERRPPRG